MGKFCLMENKRQRGDEKDKLYQISSGYVGKAMFAKMTMTVSEKYVFKINLNLLFY